MAAGLGSGRSLPLGGDHAAELRHLWRQFLILAVAGSGHGGSLARGGLGRREVGAEPCQSRFHRSDRAIDLGEESLEDGRRVKIERLCRLHAEALGGRIMRVGVDAEVDARTLQDHERGRAARLVSCHQLRP